MWIVAKYNVGQLQVLKESLGSILGLEVEYYQPKLIFEFKRKKILKNILGNYVFCKHDKFKEDKVINNLKFIKGLNYFLLNYKSEQKYISKFINKCKLHEDENKTLKQSFFEDVIKSKAKFITGPFKNIILESIIKNKNFFSAKINNLRITVKKNNTFLPL